jgi:hypothetical protein
MGYVAVEVNGRMIAASCVKCEQMRAIAPAMRIAALRKWFPHNVEMITRQRRLVEVHILGLGPCQFRTPIDRVARRAGWILAATNQNRLQLGLAAPVASTQRDCYRLPAWRKALGAALSGFLAPLHKPGLHWRGASFVRWYDKLCQARRRFYLNSQLDRIRSRLIGKDGSVSHRYLTYRLQVKHK